MQLVQGSSLSHLTFLSRQSSQLSCGGTAGRFRWPECLVAVFDLLSSINCRCSSSSRMFLTPTASIYQYTLIYRQSRHPATLRTLRHVLRSSACQAFIAAHAERRKEFYITPHLFWFNQLKHTIFKCEPIPCPKSPNYMPKECSFSAQPAAFRTSA